MNKRQKDGFVKRYKAILAQLSHDRDELRDLIADIEEVDTSCEAALEILEEAADRLSEYL